MNYFSSFNKPAILSYSSCIILLPLLCYVAMGYFPPFFKLYHVNKIAEFKNFITMLYFSVTLPGQSHGYNELNKVTMSLLKISSAMLIYIHSGSALSESLPVYASTSQRRARK